MKILQWRETVWPTLATVRVLFTEFSSKVGSTLQSREGYEESAEG
jgi:hypothetical protein